MNKNIFRAICFGVLALVLLLLGSCEENPVPLDFGKASLNHDTLYAVDDATHEVDEVVTSLSGERLMVGSAFGMTFRPILRFANITLEDTLEMLSARINLPINQGFGTNQQPFSASAHPFREFWISDTDSMFLDDETYKQYVDFTTTLAEFEINMDSVVVDSSDTLNFPEILVMKLNKTGLQQMTDWAVADTLYDTTNTETNSGFILEFDDVMVTDYIQEFTARDLLSNIGPKLIVEYETSDDSVFFDTLLVIADAVLFEGDFDRLSDRNYASSFAPWVTTIKFDLDSLKRKYSDPFLLTSANIQLPVDTVNSVIHSGFDPNLAVEVLVSPFDSAGARFDDSQGLLFNTTITRFAEGNDGYAEVSSASIDRRNLIDFIIQPELQVAGTNEGFYIQPVSFGSHLSIIAFYKADSPDPDQRPRLIITSLPAPEEPY